MAHAPNALRKEVSPSDCWDLTPLFASIDEWETLYTAIESRLAEYENFKQDFESGFERFFACIEFDHDMGRDIEKLYTYAHLKNDQDKTDGEGDSLFQRASNLYTRISDASSFIVPRIQAIPEATLESYMQQSAAIDYKFYLEKIIRNIPHTRSEEAEQLLAMAGETFGAPGRIFSQLDNADLDFGTLTDETSEQHPLTHGNFISFLSHGDRKIRQSAFDQYYTVYESHKHSISSALAASVKKDLFLARARHFDTARKAALFNDNVPEQVYDNLIENVREGLPPLFRYLDFRKKALGLDELHIYDTYVPVVRDVKFTMTYDQAAATCLEALQPLGDEYCTVLEKGLKKGWVDRYENKGKRSGAYSSGCYDSAPYILLNYDDSSINSLFTLVHEAGHSMHSWYANRAQPFATHGYTIFVAEVASTLNETLLGAHLLKTYKDDPAMRAYVLNREIDNIRGTFYRQTMFAEFEHRVHGMAARNQALTLDTFTGVYQELLGDYFGRSLVIDPSLALECLRIPHFYSAFYVYKYATGIAAALGIADRINRQGQPAVNDYLTFLKLGGAMFPIDELKLAGVDMGSAGPVQAAAAHFDHRVSELEALWPSI